MQIREIQTADAASFNTLIKIIEAESDFMLRGPGERKSTDEDQKSFIERLKQNPESRLILALSHETPVGFIMVMSEGVEKKKHSRYIAMGVLAAFSGQGVGTKLMQAAIDFSRAQQVRRLELTVITTNHKAVSLYRKLGFEIEGTKRNSIMIRDNLTDEFQMAYLSGL